MHRVAFADTFARLGKHIRNGPKGIDREGGGRPLFYGEHIHEGECERQSRLLESKPCLEAVPRAAACISFYRHGHNPALFNDKEDKARTLMQTRFLKDYKCSHELISNKADRSPCHRARSFYSGLADEFWSCIFVKYTEELFALFETSVLIFEKSIVVHKSY
jgi:hypothetical protein